MIVRAFAGEVTKKNAGVKESPLDKSPRKSGNVSILQVPLVLGGWYRMVVEILCGGSDGG